MNRYLIRVLMPLVLIGFLLAHVMGTMKIPFVSEFEKLLYDARVRITAVAHRDTHIVIVAIDEKSLEVEGHWPWTRDKLALLLEKLHDHGVALTGFDIVFPERDVSASVDLLKELAADDPIFLQKLQLMEPALNRDMIFGRALAYGPSVLAYFFHLDERATFKTGELPMSAFEFDESMADVILLPKATGYSSNPPEVMSGAHSAGFISNPLIDKDGIVRRTPLLHAYGTSVYSSLTLAMAETYLDDITLPIFVDAPLMAEGYPPLEALEIGGKQIPLDAQGGVLVPYRGPAGSFPYISASDILRDTLADPSVLDGAIVFIGATAPGLEDLRATPFGSIYPGVEIHANVLDGILSGRLRWQPAYTIATEMLAVVVVGLMAALMMPVLTPIFATLLTAVLMSGILMGNFYLWNVEMHVLPLATPILSLLGIYVLNMVFGYFFETRTRTHMNDLFGQYVPPDLVIEMANNPKNYSLASKKIELSVLFSDIRGFTGISEKLDADELSGVLNRFLTPMTQVIHDTKGTIDKYMGDAIMAFWGAPVPSPNHAHDAILAGLSMLKALREINPEFVAEGLQPLKIGVGVNTGIMSVGNMGSHFRRAYTVLGDAVNLGSRLEGLTKAYGVDFIVSEFTQAQADGFIYREIDLVRVKGRRKPVRIYEVRGIKGEVSDQEIAQIRQFEAILGLYRESQWDEAEVALKKLQTLDPKTLLYQHYIERVRAFKQKPPESDWGGVFTHTAK